MSATTQLVTAEELLKLPRGRFRHELITGELKTTSPAGEEHGVVVMNLAGPLSVFVRANALGVVHGAETGFKLATNPATVRAPDIAFVRREVVGQTGIRKGFRAGAPDLAVEVLSPGDTVSEIEQEVEEWLKAGTKAVWVLSPKLRNVTVYRSLTDVTVLAGDDELSGGNVVPGFRLRLPEIFV